MAQFENRIAIVTGAGQGIGKEIALSLAREGAKLIITDVTDQIFEVIKEIEASGGEGLAIKCDVTDPAEGIDVAEKNISQVWKSGCSRQQCRRIPVKTLR